EFRRKARVIAPLPAKRGKIDRSVVFGASGEQFDYGVVPAKQRPMATDHAELRIGGHGSRIAAEPAPDADPGRFPGRLLWYVVAQSVRSAFAWTSPTSASSATSSASTQPRGMRRVMN